MTERFSLEAHLIPVNDIVTIIIAGNVMSIERETDLALVTLMSQILLRIAYVCLWLLKRNRDIYLRKNWYARRDLNPRPTDS